MPPLQCFSNALKTDLQTPIYLSGMERVKGAVPLTRFVSPEIWIWACNFLPFVVN